MVENGQGRLFLKGEEYLLVINISEKNCNFGMHNNKKTITVTVTEPI